jgi:hypothetical protein
VVEDQSGNFSHTTDQIVGLSPDGSSILGQPGGGGSGTLYTKYGAWTLGSVQATAPGYGGGTFCEVLLNGKPVTPGRSVGIGLPAMQQLRVDFGGNLYGITNDQIWYIWDYYFWNSNDGANLASGPVDPGTWAISDL